MIRLKRIYFDSKNNCVSRIELFKEVYLSVKEESAEKYLKFCDVNTFSSRIVFNMHKASIIPGIYGIVKRVSSKILSVYLIATVTDKYEIDRILKIDNCLDYTSIESLRYMDTLFEGFNISNYKIRRWVKC